MEITKGIKGRKEYIVTKELTAAAVGSGLLEVYGTPYMIALMEETCHTSIGQFLEEGQGTVGISLEIKHTAATPVGMKVWCESQLVEVDGKRLVFKVQAFDQVGPIGEGTHQRFIIDNEKFLEKTNSKGNK
ncbi:MAG: thioesterase family protein [Firmicutes bacterium]|nr:thioesterase family protein [Bacillota bacterium]